MPVPFRNHLHYFVGRADALAAIWAHVCDDGLCSVADTVGIEGIGKTTLLTKLHTDITADGRYRVAFVNVGDAAGIAALSRTETSEHQSCSVRAGVRGMEALAHVLSALAAEIGGKAFAGFGARLARQTATALTASLKRTLKVELDLGGAGIRTGDVRVGTLSRLLGGTATSGDVSVHVDVPDRALDIDDAIAAVAIDDCVAAICDAFAQRLNSLDGPGRTVLLLDDFCSVGDGAAGRWLLQVLAPRLRDAVLVLGRAEAGDLPCQLDRSSKVQLGAFSPWELALYLRKRLQRRRLPRGLLRAVCSFSGGHPQVAAIAADLAEQHGLDNPGLLGVFAHPQASHADQIRALVDRLLGELGDGAVRRAVACAAIQRRFDESSLGALLAADTPSSSTPPEQVVNAGSVIAALSAYSFVERCPTAGGDCYRLHGFVRGQIEDELRHRDPGRHALLHAAAAGYYGKWLSAYEADSSNGSSYMRWYRFEQSDWQGAMAEWLYHLGNLHDRTDAGLELVQAYLDAFWWWGYYTPFAYCERLLEDWEETQRGQEDREWLDLLRGFDAAYPTGYLKRGVGDWADVEGCLLGILDKGHLTGDPAKLTLRDRHIRAIASIFLGDAYRYRNPLDPNAVARYAEALKLLETCGADDEWNIPWLHWLLGDLHLERALEPLCTDRATESTLAAAECEQALAAAFAPGIDDADLDREVIANTYRTCADIAGMRGEEDAAARCWALALWFAYAYQAKPQPADAYTRSHYREMLERVSASIIAIREAGRPDAALHLCDYLRRFWSPYWQRDGAAANEATTTTAEIILGEAPVIAAWIAPPLPGPADLGRRGAYVRRVLATLCAMEGDVGDARRRVDLRLGAVTGRAAGIA